MANQSIEKSALIAIIENNIKFTPVEYGSKWKEGYKRACSDMLAYIQSVQTTSTVEDVPKNSNMLDEDALDIAIRLIENNGNDCAGILDKERALNWLKSLNPNSCCWKPSLQQINKLNEISQSLNESKELIDSIINRIPK